MALAASILFDVDFKLGARIFGHIESGSAWSVWRSLVWPAASLHSFAVLAVISQVDGGLARLSSFAGQLPARRGTEGRTKGSVQPRPPFRSRFVQLRRGREFNVEAKAIATPMRCRRFP
jgi:hypothetical protein